MYTDKSQNELLTRGGRPTLRDLLDLLEFNPAQGTISLKGERMLLTRASFFDDLRDQLMRRYNEHDAMVLMLRLGFRSGREDAEFIRQSWPTLDPGDAFTAGTRLHMVTGTVKVETISNDFDFDSDRFTGDFLWHESVEASNYQRRHGRATKPVCWLQTGYASGYASVFFRRLVIYKELSCSATGHKSCRVVGKTVDGWGPDDPFVQFFLREVIGPQGTPWGIGSSAKRKTQTQPHDDLTSLVLSPVHERLKKVATNKLPALICGPVGAGCRLAARWLYHQRYPESTFQIIHAEAPDLTARLAALRQTPEQSQAQSQGVVIADIEKLPIDRQYALLDLLMQDRGHTPLVVTLSTRPPDALLSDMRFLPELAYELSVFPVCLPDLNTRKADVPRLAEKLLAIQGPTRLSDDAATLLASIHFRAGLTELRCLLSRAALLAEQPELLSASDLRLALSDAPPDTPTPEGDMFWSMLQPAFTKGDVTFDSLSASILHGALHASGGNVAAAARLLGVSRAQMAYRIQASKGPQ